MIKCFLYTINCLKIDNSRFNSYKTNNTNKSFNEEKEVKVDSENNSKDNQQEKQ